VPTPDTIVLIHGFWVTPRSWEHWKARYEAKGFTVHTPTYPGFEGEVEALRADPTPIADLTIEAIVDHLEAFLDTLESPPILMGHSAGGAFMQVVMDHGYGSAGVGLNSAPTEGVRVTPWTQLHSVFPVLKNLEFTGSLRYDSYEKVNSKFVFSTNPDANGNFQQIANADLGNTFNEVTYKISARWTPIEKVLIRGSYGTGFKAPTFGDIAGPLVFNGSTANSYTCPFPGTSGCIAGSAQYDLLAGPNGLSGDAGLKPEKSKQWVLGGRWDPIKEVSLGADFWNVKIKDQIHALDAGLALGIGYRLMKGNGMNLNLQYYYGLIDVVVDDSTPDQFNRVLYLTAGIPIGKNPKNKNNAKQQQ